MKKKSFKFTHDFGRNNRPSKLNDLFFKLDILFLQLRKNHSVWKSQKKSHSTTSEAVYTSTQKFIKNAKNG